VSPKSHKISLLTGALHRINNATSCKVALEEGISKMKKKFILNDYPPKLVESKIAEMRAANFRPLARDNSEIAKTYYFCASYTNHRCEKIGYKMQQIIRNITPSFLLRVAWKTVRLEQIIFPRLKRQIPKTEKSGLIYQFKCHCKAEYYGETLRTLKTRIYEHLLPSKESPIFLHIRGCDQFQIKYHDYLSEPNTPKNLTKSKLLEEYTTRLFKINNSNLPYRRDRKLTESFVIKLNDPVLNKQVEFEPVNFL
jgi:hypothetical protein